MNQQRGYSKAWYEWLARQPGPKWMGRPLVKHPNDLFSYQQIVYETRPGLIVETGTFAGGSALYLAHLCDLANHGRVISIDIKQWGDLPDHPRVDFWTGKSSTDPDVIDMLHVEAHQQATMVILDSAHNYGHVTDELNRYAPLVTADCYLVVEDTNRDGYFLGRGDITGGDGPAEAVKAWQPSNRGFQVDRSRELFGFTQNPGGYLRRTR